MLGRSFDVVALPPADEDVQRQQHEEDLVDQRGRPVKRGLREALDAARTAGVGAGLTAWGTGVAVGIGVGTDDGTATPGASATSGGGAGAVVSLSR